MPSIVTHDHHYDQEVEFSHTVAGSLSRISTLSPPLIASGPMRTSSAPAQVVDVVIKDDVAINVDVGV